MPGFPTLDVGTPGKGNRDAKGAPQTGGKPGATRAGEGRSGAAPLQGKG